MIPALHAEWTKLRSEGGTGWLLLGAIAAMAAVSVVALSAVKYRAGGADVDTIKLSLTGIELGQAVVAILGVLAISGEYSSGMIRVTLAAMPRRPAVLAAKASVVTAVVLAAGTIAVLGCLLVGRLMLPGNGFTATHGYAALSLADGPTLRAAVGSVLYLVLIALLSLGIATIVRDAATAIGVVLGLLYLFPIITALVSNPHWQRHLQQIGPMSAGLAVQATSNLRSLPIGPWAGLCVLAAWAGGALFAGGVMLKLRDA